MGKTKNETKPLQVRDPKSEQSKLKWIGGSHSDDFNHILINQAIRTLWMKHSSEETREQQFQTVLATMIGVAPKDELEGMLAAQLVATHAASMECYRRAMLDEQTFEGRKENLTQANKLSRTYTMLLDALNRHRGKGQQKVTVEHVHVHSGGQAIVGSVEQGGVSRGKEEQPHAKAISHAPQSPLWSEDQKRDALPVAGDAERPVPDARRRVSGGANR